MQIFCSHEQLFICAPIFPKLTTIIKFFLPYLLHLLTLHSLPGTARTSIRLHTPYAKFLLTPLAFSSKYFSCGDQLKKFSNLSLAAIFLDKPIIFLIFLSAGLVKKLRHKFGQRGKINYEQNPLIKKRNFSSYTDSLFVLPRKSNFFSSKDSFNEFGQTRKITYSQIPLIKKRIFRFTLVCTLNLTLRNIFVIIVKKTFL